MSRVIYVIIQNQRTDDANQSTNNYNRAISKSWLPEKKQKNSQ